MPKQRRPRVPGVSNGGTSLASKMINDQNWGHTGPLERYGRRMPGARGLQMTTVIPRTRNGYSIWSRGQFETQNNKRIFPYLTGFTPRIILPNGIHLWIRPNNNNTSVAYGF